MRTKKFYIVFFIIFILIVVVTSIDFILNRYYSFYYSDIFLNHHCTYHAGYILRKFAEGADIDITSLLNGKSYKTFISKSKLISLLDAAIKEHAERFSKNLKEGDLNENGTINKERYINNHKDEIMFQEIFIKHIFKYAFPAESNSKVVPSTDKSFQSSINKLAQEMVKNTLESKGYDTSNLDMTKREIYLYALPKHRAEITKIFTEYCINCKTFRSTEIKIN